ncbi:MAG TPA: hypothetical protein DDZ81_15690 [Acetobacteraceae bacterium]|jgi:tetratricopeptide (TPR) repeat protein|nr:hypothetical protein [Acetobacteraceae bacterium]
MMFMRQSEADQLVMAATTDIGAGQIESAALRLDAALRLEPGHLLGMTRQAEIASWNKEYTRTFALTDAVLAKEPNFAPAWYERSVALWATGRIKEAVAAAARAHEIQPPNPTFRLRLAQFAAWTGAGETTLKVIAPLLENEAYDPDNHAAAVSMMGELAIAEGRFADAMPYIDHALSLRPGANITRMLRGMNLLRLGRFQQGWDDYAAREVIPALYPDSPRKLAKAVWRGEDLTGKTLIVTDDQGHGDAIQFFRYLPLLRDRGAAHIVWRTFVALVRLFAESAPYATVLNGVSDEAFFDFECKSTTLPRWFGTTVETIPATIPYLTLPSRRKSPPGRTARRRLNVGLVWSGDTRHMRDHLRSIPAEQFLGLTAVAGIDFHSLQHQVRPPDLPALQAHPSIRREIETASDFADTALLIDKLDLVIAVDTGVAHLAAALGKPVWLIVDVAPDWRWMADRTDSPWYPSIRLFRVTRAEGRRGAGWRPVLKRVATALRRLAAG